MGHPAPIHYLQRCEKDGYPNLDFEFWYQIGMECHQARLPRPYRIQALRRAADRWYDRTRQRPELWMLRAFAYGAAGRDQTGVRQPRLPADFVWPTPPDPAWGVVVCCYPDGFCDLDMVHPVSRRFYSERHGFFDPPLPKSVFTRDWFETMGFDVLLMTPSMMVEVAHPARHLSVVSVQPQGDFQ